MENNDQLDNGGRHKPEAVNYELPEILLTEIKDTIGAQIKKVILEDGNRLVVYLSGPTTIEKKNILQAVRIIVERIKSSLAAQLSEEYGYVADTQNSEYMLRFNDFRIITRDQVAA